AFRQQLLADPRAAIAAEIGRAVPEEMEIRVVEETASVRYLVLPRNTAQLSDEQLDLTAGGECNSDYCHFCQCTEDILKRAHGCTIATRDGVSGPASRDARPAPAAAVIIEDRLRDAHRARITLWRML